MRISSIELPLSVYAISKDIGTDNFSVSTPGLPAGANIILKEGNYSNINNPHDNNDCPYIVDIIQNQLTSNFVVPDISYSIDPASQKSIFTSTGSFTINFNVDSQGKVDLDSPLPLKLGWLLGFRGGAYNSINNQIISEGICSITGPKYIYLCINDFTNAANNYFTAAFTNSTISPYIIARMNYQTLLQSDGIYKYTEDDEFSNSHNRTREYFGPVDIQKLHFQILDEYGRVINLNNMDWSCALTFDILYD